LEFANVAVQAGQGGTVVLDPVGTVVRGVSENAFDGCTLPVIFGSTPTAAEYDIHGTATYTYSIVLPADCIITNTTGTGGEHMHVSPFLSAPTLTGTLNASGYEVLFVGATLNVDAGQIPGHYVSATPFDVTVNYN
jgi:hypothetical protein